VTYDGHPLYIYSQEQSTGLTGTARNGNGTELDGGTLSLITPQPPADPRRIRPPTHRRCPRPDPPRNDDEPRESGAVSFTRTLWS
jgi:hypothetical protein